VREKLGGENPRLGNRSEFLVRRGLLEAWPGIVGARKRKDDRETWSGAMLGGGVREKRE